ncbi:MAG: A/G-specific adenine glycosylase [Candidatus Marinarcus sp.]|uniref:A/G-specific adenine glycosylase n=1 Tax=Candidatus Marinarcus sp. TaxID=3100987 RepID=UPI003B00511C
MKKPPLIQWYEKHGRHDLPWRNTTDPYPIYLSEIMLQQTQVKTVLERFYFQFLQKFPTLEALAKAQEDEVLKAWEGLGYYTRARNLHKTAQLTQGILPQTLEALEALPGIGPSTARAIACFAFGLSVPILDGNVKRILYRYFARTHANEKELWALANQLFEADKNFAYEHNQALMDMGSFICTRTQPKCRECPLELSCLGKELAWMFPAKKAKKPKELRHRNLVIYTHKNKIALFQNEENLLKGLYGFRQYSDELDASYTFLGEIKHEYSHISLRAKVYTKEVELNSFKAWFDEEEVESLALSKADHKALALLF